MEEEELSKAAAAEGGEEGERTPAGEMEDEEKTLPETQPEEESDQPIPGTVKHSDTLMKKDSLKPEPVVAGTEDEEMKESDVAHAAESDAGIDESGAPAEGGSDQAPEDVMEPEEAGKEGEALEESVSRGSILHDEKDSLPSRSHSRDDQILKRIAKKTRRRQRRISTAPDGVGADEEGGESVDDTGTDESEYSAVGIVQLDAAKELQVKEKKKKPEEKVYLIPENFFYKYEEICPPPFVTPDSGVPPNILQLTHSFGYDCTKRANLQLLDDQTIIYIAGSNAVILDLKTKAQVYLRSTSGGGIGNIAVHHSKNYFAVAEKGENPNVIVYEYPSLQPYRIMRGGTVEAYAFVDFNVSGTLLASVGSNPDFMLTVWNWRQEKIILRSKAFSQDVFRATFSTENEEQLTTSGQGHIKFWKMALTFTGLKLQGALGRFGKTGLSDIEGYVELPDGKVVSGSEWGNMLLWEGGLIKVEFCRKGKKPCHVGQINQLVLDEGELISIGEDGYVRVWDFELVDTAETEDDEEALEMEPMNELLVGKHVNLRSMVKVSAARSHIWFAQDAYGAIWKLDLSFSNITQDPECLFLFHSEKIEALDASPTTHLVATTSLDRSVRIYDILGKSEVVEMKFKQGGTTLLWAPRLVNPKGGLFAVGFEDGVVRLLEVYNPTGLTLVAGRTSTGDAEIRLKQAFKPHNAPVTALAFERDGDLLATGSSDSTVFFFATGEKYYPIGFINVPGPVKVLQWSPLSHESNMLLVLCENGYAVQVPAPSSGLQTPALTYEIQELPLQYFRFYSIKSKLEREKEIIARIKRKEEKQKERLEWLEKQKEKGIELTEEELEEVPEEEPELPPIYIPEEPSPVLAGFYSTPGKFWLSLGGFDSGLLYHCEFQEDQDDKADPSKRKDEPFYFMSIEHTEQNPIRIMYFSNNQQLLFCGMENGAVRVYPLAANDPQLTTMYGYWTLGIHDNQYGYIQSICSTFDNQFLLTSGGDGNVFSFSIMSHEEIEKDMKEKRAKIPSPRALLEHEKVAEDIEDPSAYSIEDAKQKLKHDLQMREADEKKYNKRRELKGLRSKFSKLLQKNLELPKELQLERAEFEMDARIREEMERLTSERIRTVLKELAWEQEKHRIGLHKLETRFRSSVEYDTLVLHAIQTKHQVSTYRLLTLSDKSYRARGQLGKKIQSRFDPRVKESDVTREVSEEGMPTDTDKGGNRMFGRKYTHNWVGLAGQRADKLAKIIEKADKAKAKIFQRKKEWEKLLEQRPSDNYEDPEDVLAIKTAAENMGDYKLKAAPNYTVPEHMRMTADRKRYELGLLEELVHDRKAAMNQWIVSLRDFKVAMIEEIQILVNDLIRIQSTLDISKQLPVPTIPRMHPDEMPEKRFEYNRAVLEKFLIMEGKKAASMKRSDRFGGFGGFRESDEQVAASKVSVAGSQLTQISSRVTSSAYGLRHSSMASSLPDTTQKDVSEYTELVKEMIKAEEIRNTFYQDQIGKKIMEDIATFDAELRLLRHQKIKMDLQMKMGDLKHITLFEELLFLKDFEKLEDHLQENVNLRLNEQEELKWKSEEFLQQLEAKKALIAKIQEREKNLFTVFQASLGENNKFAGFLTRVFKRKIKRVKKKEVQGSPDDDAGSDEESDEEEWESDDDDAASDEEPIDDSMCPDNCDPVLFDNTIKMRETRLDLEEAQVEEKKLVDNIKKDFDTLAKKIKGVGASLTAAEDELEAFQREKQKKVNELHVVVPLRLHQVEYVTNGDLPADMSEALVFTNHSLEALQQRIRELQMEKAQQRDLYKNAREQHKQLIRDRKEMEAKTRLLEETCRQQMMTKFGRVVDLQVLQTLSVNINLEELKIQSLQKEAEMDKELREWEKKTRALKQRMIEVTREHTMKLEAINRLLSDKVSLESRLDARQTNVGEEFRGPRRADLEEKARLIELVEVQLQEIDALKEEMCLLSRKGGNILPPAQPPLPQTSGVYA